MDVVQLNVIVGWVWITLGLVSGIPLGMVFHREDAFGGYGAWPRRLCRLGHIAFFGTGFLNLMFVFSLPHVAINAPVRSVVAAALLAGAVTMPPVCFLAAWRKSARHLFALPVVSLVGGAVTFTVAIILSAISGGGT